MYNIQYLGSWGRVARGQGYDRSRGMMEASNDSIDLRIWVSGELHDCELAI